MVDVMEPSGRRIRTPEDVQRCELWPLEANACLSQPHPMRQCGRRYEALQEILCSIPGSDFWQLEGRSKEFDWLVPEENNPGANMAIDAKPQIQHLPDYTYRVVIFLSPSLEYAAWPLILSVIAHELAHFFLRHKRFPGPSMSQIRQERHAQAVVRKWGFEKEADVFDAWHAYMKATEEWAYLQVGCNRFEPVPCVAVDSNALTYFIEAAIPSYDPWNDKSEELRRERVAMLRIHLYHTILTLSPTVQQEAKAIPDGDRRQIHAVFGDTVFDERKVRAPNKLADRIAELRKLHSDGKDCRVLAEAEEIGAQILLTGDKDFRRRLDGATDVWIMSPSEYWRALDIKPGPPLRVAPAPTNPLSKQSWWRWVEDSPF